MIEWIEWEMRGIICWDRMGYWDRMGMGIWILVSKLGSVYNVSYGDGRMIR